MHVLNRGRLPDGPCRWQVIKRATVSGRELRLVKGVHRSGNRGFVDLVVVPAAGDGPPHTESAPLLGIDAEELQQMARDAGATDVSLYGDYQRSSFDSGQSPDIIVVAYK